ncbi:uncharacterized protein LOC131690211 [Topomyia yanbarensis]|uniref:uncharacterized protein LOC131690211 n=1 Tax=Topomyia yanbarensis TaxID=2498891 RepID=UPI00273C5919|nr:uncharacterized protein LOC131690211 [Topomyia yanbarensis]XP_058831777.1 uncharacterized protein LOC131690211 [Topomyia yanbarensis]
MESLSAETRGEIYEKLWTRMPRLNPGPMGSFRIDDFISLIKRYPIIYNRVDKHNKQEYSDTWDHLEAILKTPKKFLMMKWKGLRDNFRVELKKEFFSPPENRYISKWVHYKKLLFLKEQVLLTLDQKLESDSHDELNQIMQFVQNATQEHTPAVSTERVSEHSYANGDQDLRELIKIKEERDDSDDAHDTADEADYSFSHFHEPENAYLPGVAKVNPLPEITITPKIISPSINTNDSINLRRKRHSEESLDSHAVPAKRQLKQFGVPHDDDYHFLMSIHPYLKQLPLPVKLKVRLQMQQVLFNELMKQPIASEED